MNGDGAGVRQVADRYRLERRIGRGGAGAVWRAHDDNLDRKVAIKQIPIAADAEAGSRERAMREARATARLHVPNVVQVYDVIEEGEHIHLVMELVDAPNLNTLVRRGGPLEPREVARLGLQMLDALQAAHRAGIVHRDVKPSNVLMDGDTARLTDFGIARLSDDPTLTATGVVMGTPAYIAPEHARGAAIGPAVDYYGLGATLYYAVEGTSPFAGHGSVPTVMAVISSPPRPLARAGPLANLLMALLAKDPDARPGPDEIRRQLREVAGTPVRAPGMAAALPPPADGQTADPPPDDDAVEADGPADASSPAASRPAAPLSAGAAPLSAGAAPPSAGAAPPSAGAAPPRDAPPPDRRWPRRGFAMLASVLALLLVASFAVNSMVDDGQSASGDEPSPPAAAAVPGASETASTDGVPVGDAPPTLEDAPPPSDQPSTTSTAPGDGTDDGVLPSTDIDVPSDWVEYTPDDAPYRLRHPPGWNVVQVSDTLTDIRDPQSATYLRLDWVAETRDPVGAWENLEPSFAARHSDYENLGITPTTFKGDRAALWEYRYRSGGRSLHAYNLGVNAGDYGFALNLQTTQDDWTDAQELWAQLLSSYEFTGP